MKTTLLILLSVFGLNFSYSQNEKKILSDFGHAVANDNIELEKVIDTYLNYDPKAKEITLQQLQGCRDKWKLKSEDVAVYSYNEGLTNGKGFEIVTGKYDLNRIYFIYFNKELTIPILLNSNSKIISISTMNKGETRFLMVIGKE
jgi:hypothetical protein